MAPQRIALIEDDADIRRMLAETLSDEGFTVTASAHPRELARTWRGDLIVTDTFGRYRPASIARRVRALRGRHGCSIIIISAHAEVERDGDSLGADAVVAKPFDLDVLLTTIDGVLRARSL